MDVDALDRARHLNALKGVISTVCRLDFKLMPTHASGVAPWVIVEKPSVFGRATCRGIVVALLHVTGELTVEVELVFRHAEVSAPGGHRAMRTEEAPIVGKGCRLCRIILVQVLPILSVVKLVESEVAGVIAIPAIRYLVGPILYGRAKERGHEQVACCRSGHNNGLYASTNPLPRQ